MYTVCTEIIRILNTLLLKIVFYHLFFFSGLSGQLYFWSDKNTLKYIWSESDVWSWHWQASVWYHVSRTIDLKFRFTESSVFEYFYFFFILLLYLFPKWFRGFKSLSFNSKDHFKYFLQFRATDFRWKPIRLTLFVSKPRLYSSQLSFCLEILCLKILF